MIDRWVVVLENWDGNSVHKFTIQDEPSDIYEWQGRYFIYQKMSYGCMYFKEASFDHVE